QQNAQQYPPKLAEREPSDRVVRVGRKLADSIGLGVQSAPGRALILSYSEDGEKETERLVVNGSVQLSNVVSQKPATDPSERSTFVEDLYTMSFDVDQTRETEEDTISFAWGRTWHLIPGWTAAEDGRFGWNSSLGISYATDRHWDRDVYQASWKGLLSKQTWGRMGYPLADHGGLRFAWQPTLEAQVGKVADDGGNAMLAMQKAAGTYYRLIPKLEAQYWPRILDDRLQFFASAARVHDYSLDEGFGQYSADLQFRIAANMWLVASYTKGHSVITLDKVDRWLLGFGVAL
nr:hypothetical protein [Xanthomonadales bacterium]